MDEGFELRIEDFENTIENQRRRREEDPDEILNLFEGDGNNNNNTVEIPGLDGRFHRMRVNDLNDGRPRFLMGGRRFQESTDDNAQEQNPGIPLMGSIED